MFALLTAHLASLFSPSHDEAQEEYLASSSDLWDLERRMRDLDRDDYSSGLHSNSVPRDNER